MLAAVVFISPARFARAADDAGVDAEQLKEVLERAADYLKSHQEADGSFSPKVAGPGVTAVVAAGMLRNGFAATIPWWQARLAYLEKNVQKDGGIYDKRLANYTTSVAMMAFQEANKDGKYDSILKNGAKFLKRLQYGDRGEGRQVRRRRLRQRRTARPVQHAVFHRRPAGGRRVQGRSGHQAGHEVRQPLPEPARRNQRSAVRQEDDRGRQGRPGVHSLIPTTRSTRRRTAACVRWAP